MLNIEVLNMIGERVMRRSALMQFKRFEVNGEYRDIQIELDAILDGDVDAIKIKSRGSAEFTGNVIAKEARFGGLCKIGGNCNIDFLEVCGESKIDGNIIADELIVDGKLKCNGKLLECNKIKLSGTITSGGELKASVATGKGGLVLEKIESDNIDLIFNKKTTLKEIKGTKINIIGTKSKGFISKCLSKGGSLVEINNIVGNDITLENIEAKSVKGHNIKIGENCIIEKVEYTGEININANSKVTKKIKL
ncbi:hypothetical protein [Clostridium gasigenes]|nr:hypothetical protein [Clostridium gasigenes]